MRPFPEFSGNRYSVTPTKAEPGFPNTDLGNFKMAVPLGDGDVARAIRAHEVAHALYSTVVGIDEAKAAKVRKSSYMAAEELRINTLVERAGVSMDECRFESDYQSAAVTIIAGDLRETARCYCTQSGAGRRHEFMRAWNENAPLLNDDYVNQCEQVFEILDSKALHMRADDSRWAFKVGRYLDRLYVAPPEPKDDQGKQEQRRGEQQARADKQQQAASDKEDELLEKMLAGEDPDEQEFDEPPIDADDWDDDKGSQTTEKPSDDAEPEPKQGEGDGAEDEPDEQAPDDFADGESDDDPLDGIDSPHCEIDWSQLKESDLKRALKQMADKGMLSWDGTPATEMPNAQVTEAAWMKLNVKDPDRPIQTKNGFAARKPRAARSGRFRRGDQLWVEDGRPFERRMPAAGGTVVVDVSGSMAISEHEIEDILEAAPGCTIAVYNSVHNLTIIVQDGKRVERLPMGGGYNGVDGPSLRWLAQQKAPRVWVSDGYVNGAMSGRYGVTTEDLYTEVAEICLAGRILRVDPHVRRRDDWAVFVPAAFVGYKEVAEALRNYHRMHGNG